MRVKRLAAVTERYRMVREEQSASSRIFLRFRCSARSRLFRRAVYARFCTPCFCPHRFVRDASQIGGKAGTKRCPLARQQGGALSDSRLFYGIPVGKEQAGSIKCFVLLAAAAFALAGVRACPQRACQTVRAVCRRVRVRRVFLATVDMLACRSYSG